MRTSTVFRNGVSQPLVDLILCLIDMIPWPIRRSGMGAVTTTLLDGKPRIAEDVFGWGRATVELGMNLKKAVARVRDALHPGFL